MSDQTVNSNSLNALRTRATQVLLAFLWVQPVVLMVSGIVRHAHWMSAAGASLIVAAAVSAFGYFNMGRNPNDDTATRYLIGVAVMLAPAFMVYMLTGDAWQLDAHMYFFASLAMLVAFCDWRVIVVATATVAVHHLLLNFTYAYAVFPDGADLMRVVFHAVVIVIEAGALIWISLTLAQAFVASDHAVQAAQRATERAETLSNEQIRTQAKADEALRKRLNEVADELEVNIGRLADGLDTSAKKLDDMALMLHENMEQSKMLAGSVSLHTGETETSMRSVLAAAQTLDSSVQDIDTQSRISHQTTQEAYQQTEQADIMVRDLMHKAQTINDIVSLISDIAGQTNLLALNATIEAARAGEYGKGFAVVASEVKTLAGEAAKAAEDIAAHAEAIQDVSTRTAQAIGEISTVANNAQEASAQIAGAVQQQAALTREISDNIKAVTQSTQVISQDIGTIHTHADDIAQTSHNLRTHMGDLRQSAAALRTDLSAFLEKIRT